MATITAPSSRQLDRTERQQRRRRNVWSYLAMALFAVIFLFPMVFMFISSLKPDAQILSDVRSLNAFLPVATSASTTTATCSTASPSRGS